MDKKDPKEEVVETPNPKISELEEANRLLMGEMRDQRSQFDRLSGQLSVITEAARGSQQEEPEEELDIIGDPEGALNKLWNKRALPVIHQQNVSQANTQMELIAVKRKEDWESYKDHVAALVAKGGIKPEVLAQPGAYDHLLDLARSKDIDNIVKKQVEAQVGDFQAKSAMSGPGVARKVVVQGESETTELTDEEKFISGKLGISEEAYTEASKGTTFDGVRIRGGVNH